MKSYKEDFIKIVQSERGILLLMILNFLFSLGLAIFALVRLNPNNLVTRIGYGDIGGYREGAWNSQLSFVIAAVLFGILHNILTLKIFHKRGSGMAKFFLLITTMLVLGALIVLIRLLREG